MSFEKLNLEVEKWSSESAAMMSQKVQMLTNSSKHEYIKARKGLRLYQSIKSKTKQRFGAIERIIFPFAKHGFFLATGASRGHKAKTNPREKKDWYGFIFEQRFEKLADIVAENYADAVINSLMADKKELK